ncbi:TonB-dependent receptor plug domain-containing protein [Caulobacter sp. S45]|uniref:TonB-dependent receptor plug domain-containing protein n=1 Tax=Caulobacter sp. S45 TaxID=1641861 RepID=UPI002738E758|nr:TonB-dependent receptor plug domain-containing protein [Caulobacter sp. S45]
MNLDNIYLGLATSAASPFYDLERVEVVKGPQGTLYGRNATGGAVNIIPEKPQLGTTSGYVSASYGNYDAYGIDGAVNVPVGDRSALRISADFLGHSGYLYDGTSDEDTKAGRIQFLTRPIPNLSIRISADYADLGGAGEGAQYLNSFAYNRTTGGYVVTPSNIPSQFGLYSTPSQNYIQQFPPSPQAATSGRCHPTPS